MTQTAETAAPQSTALATIAPPRLPFPKGVEERFGIDRTQWKALVEAVFPMAKSPDSVVLALAYCRARRLDPFKRVVHIVPIWDSANKREVETVWPGIAEHRTTAMRTGKYGGAEATVFGPVVEERFEGATKNGPVSVVLKFPEWCQITVYRMVDSQRVAVPGPRVYWREYFSKLGRANVPNDRWQRAPFQMIEKCAEAAALRRAFPEEFGDEATVEESGFFDQPPMKDVTPPPPPSRQQFTPASKPAAPPTEADERAADRMAEQYARTGSIQPIGEEGPELYEKESGRAPEAPESSPLGATGALSVGERDGTDSAAARVPPFPAGGDLAAVRATLAGIATFEAVNAWEEAHAEAIKKLPAIRAKNVRQEITDRRAEINAAEGGGQ
ncbi:MAG: phage recombination protein Bet [Azospirillum sp.]|nr:phage recombination protein Bet [Azospirillum sp.]MCA3268560.1 phage recombination protein Bet [Azospirillum sp.]